MYALLCGHFRSSSLTEISAVISFVTVGDMLPCVTVFKGLFLSVMCTAVPQFNCVGVQA